MVRKTLFSLRHLNPNGLNRLYPVRAVVFLDASAPRGPAASLSCDREVEVLRHLIASSPLAGTPGHDARAFEWFCAAGTDRLYLARPSVDPDETANEILRVMDAVPTRRA